MNFQILSRRILGHATCIIGKSSRLTFRAKIINMTGRDESISIGAHSIIQGELLAFAHGGKIECGDWCYIGVGTRIWSGAQISIGNRVLISHNVNIVDSLTHPIDAVERHVHFRQIAESGHPKYISLGDRPIVLRDDCWIGMAAIILRGVTVGEGAIVGAGAVVTKNVPPNVIVAGNPARIVRHL